MESPAGPAKARGSSRDAWVAFALEVGLGGAESSSGGVGLIRPSSKGLRGMGRKICGPPSSDMVWMSVGVQRAGGEGDPGRVWAGVVKKKDGMEGLRTAGSEQGVGFRSCSYGMQDPEICASTVLTVENVLFCLCRRSFELSWTRVCRNAGTNANANADTSWVRS